MFSFFRKKTPTPDSPAPAPAPVAAPATAPAAAHTPVDTAPQAPAQAEPAAAPRQSWLSRLTAGLRKTGSSIATVFTGTKIDDALYEELETALLMADTGVKATEHLLADLK